MTSLTYLKKIVFQMFKEENEVDSLFKTYKLKGLGIPMFGLQKSMMPTRALPHILQLKIRSRKNILLVFYLYKVGTPPPVYPMLINMTFWKQKLIV